MDWLLAALEMGTQVLACQATTIECSLDCFQTGTIIPPSNELINSYLLLNNTEIVLTFQKQQVFHFERKPYGTSALMVYCSLQL